MFCCLKNVVDVEDAPWFSLEGQYLRCKVQEVYDGDTVTIIFPFNGKAYKDKCRLAGIDAPEIRTKNEIEKREAINVRDWLSKKVLGKLVWIRFGKKDKYGRLLGHIYLDKKAKLSLNQIMVDQGMVCAYDGKAKKKFEDWYGK